VARATTTTKRRAEMMYFFINYLSLKFPGRHPQT